MKDKKKVFKSKKNIIKICIYAFAFLSLIVGFSYAYFSVTLNGNRTNLIISGCFKIEMEEDNILSLTNSTPITDAEGLASDPYIFKIENQCDLPAQYTVTISVEDTSTNGNDSKVKIAMGGVDTLEPTIISDLSTTALSNVPSDIVNSYILTTGYLDSGESRTFSTNLWIDEDVTSFSGTFDSRIIIDAIVDQTMSSNLDTSKANRPKLSSNMIPVYYDSTNSVWRKADFLNINSDYQWYDYTNQIWANAVTVKAIGSSTSLTLADNNTVSCGGYCDRNDYVNSDAGTIIPINDINGMYVWIPRFSASVNGTENAITINFVSKVKEALDAFWFDTDGDGTSTSKEEVSGFWYSKFEVSGSLSNTCTTENCDISFLTVLPNSSALTNQSISSFYYAARSAEASCNAYGFVSSKIDSHLSKNNEWGAVAYLTQSIYGRCSNSTTCSEVTINDNSTTGGTSYTSNINQSSTNNVYGIYDLSGGKNEYVMGNFNQIASSGFTALPSSKYINIYSGTSYSGHALSETQGWYSDNSTFITTSSPWFVRGGLASESNAAGIFSYVSADGSGSSNISMRFALIADTFINEEQNTPTCVWTSGPSRSTIGIDETTTFVLTCTDESTFIDSSIISSEVLSSGTGALTVTNISKTSVNNGYAYTITAKGTTKGTATLSLKANSVTDEWFNNNLVSSATNTITIKDYSIYCLWLSGPTPTRIADGETATYVLNCTNMIGFEDSDLIASDFTVGGTSGAISITNIVKSAITGGYGYTITVTGTTINGTGTLTLNAGALSDTQSNTSDPSSESTAITVLNDETAPVCTFTSSLPDYIKSGESTSITLNCTDNIGISSSSIANGLTATSGATIGTVTTTGSSASYTYTIPVTVTSGDYGTKSVTLAANTIADGAGNGNAAVTSNDMVGVYATYSNISSASRNDSSWLWIYDFNSYAVSAAGLITFYVNGNIYSTNAYSGYNQYHRACLSASIGTDSASYNCTVSSCAYNYGQVSYGYINDGQSYNNRYWANSTSSTSKITNVMSLSLNAAVMSSGQTAYSMCSYSTSSDYRNALSAAHVWVNR